MQKKNNDNGVIFSAEEIKSLSKIIEVCHKRISRLVNDVDFLGREDHYRALQMWDEKLKGRSDGMALTDFVDDGKPRKEKTIDEWLVSYGRHK